MNREIREEDKNALADREYWRGLIKSPDYFLIGWTYRQEATFAKVDGNGGMLGSVEVTSKHLELLGLKSSV
tara:strand:+ start:405 stop:617 length:213 start_codon:yes stop_codon:yes gene_type:complete